MPDILDKQTIKALGADARQDIMKLLAKRPHTASELAKATRKHVTTISEHLEVLEKSDLVKKKESTNKWVYYELTDKGAHLFKPQFYSWVIVFSLSVIFVFIGFLRLFRYDGGLEMAGSDALSQAPPASNAATAVPFDFIAYGLLILGLIGLGYLAYRKFLKK